MTEPVTHLVLESAGLGTVTVDAAALGSGLAPDEGRDLRVVGEVIKLAAAEQPSAVHPEHPGISNLELTGPLGRTDAGELTARDAVVVGPGRLDRSSCGTGTSARLAVLHAHGLVAAAEDSVRTSVIGSRSDSRIESLTTVGGASPGASATEPGAATVPAVVPSVAGPAWTTQLGQVGVDPGDPFPDGCTLADTWGAAPPSELAARLLAPAPSTQHAGGAR